MTLPRDQIVREPAKRPIESIVKPTGQLAGGGMWGARGAAPLRAAPRGADRPGGASGGSRGGARGARSRDRIREEFLGHEPATVIQAAEALTRFSSHDWIGRVDVPGAVVVTTLDGLVPATWQYKLAASIPGAEVFEVEGDHDACVAPGGFVPTLVRACLTVASRCDVALRPTGSS